MPNIVPCIYGCSFQGERLNLIRELRSKKLYLNFIQEIFFWVLLPILSQLKKKKYIYIYIYFETITFLQLKNVIKSQLTAL